MNKTPFGRIKSEIAPIGYTYSVDLEMHYDNVDYNIGLSDALFKQSNLKR